MQQLELSLQQRAEQLSHLERQSEQTEWRRGEELRKREERLRELQLELDRERGKEPAVKAGLLRTHSFFPFLLNKYLLLQFFLIFFLIQIFFMPFALYVAVILQIPQCVGNKAILFYSTH